MKLGNFCEGSYPTGLFYFTRELWTDEGVKQAADTGANFLASAETSEPLVSLCEKYRLGIISNSNVKPSWWGGDGKNAGTYADQFPVEILDKIDAYPASSSVWGDYFIDEPNSKDFAHINKVIARYRERFPGKLALVNLYPNYGSIPKNTGEEIIQQLGNTGYAEHIDQYIEQVDLPYLCFDFYPFTGSFNTYLENLDSAARACKKSNREMWVVIQAGAWTQEEILEAFQLDWQVNMCLAWGARAIMFACYSKGWWNETTSCVNNQGEKNKTWDYVRDIISVLHSDLGREFQKYEYLYTRIFGDMDFADSRIKHQLERQNKTDIPQGFPEIKITGDRAIAAGFFKNKEGFALMITNTHNPFDGSITANVRINNKETTLDLALPAGGGEFITLTENGCICSHFGNQKMVQTHQLQNQKIST